MTSYSEINANWYRLGLTFCYFPPRLFFFFFIHSLPPGQQLSAISRFHGVMVSTLDSESSDPSSNLGGTLFFYQHRTKKAGIAFLSLEENDSYSELFSKHGRKWPVSSAG